MVTMTQVLGFLYRNLPEGCVVGVEERPIRPKLIASRWKRLWRSFWGKRTTVLEPTVGLVEFAVLVPPHLATSVNPVDLEARLNEEGPVGILFELRFYDYLARPRPVSQSRFLNTNWFLEKIPDE